MKVESIELSTEDIQSIKDAVRERRPVNFYCYTLTLEQKQRFQNILNVFLEILSVRPTSTSLSDTIFFALIVL